MNNKFFGAASPSTSTIQLNVPVSRPSPFIGGRSSSSASYRVIGMHVICNLAHRRAGHKSINPRCDLISFSALADLLSDTF